MIIQWTKLMVSEAADLCSICKFVTGCEQLPETSHALLVKQVVQSSVVC